MRGLKGQEGQLVSLVSGTAAKCQFKVRPETEHTYIVIWKGRVLGHLALLWKYASRLDRKWEVENVWMECGMSGS